MKHLIVIVCVALLSWGLWSQRHTQRMAIEKENDQLQAQVATHRSRISNVEQEREKLLKRLEQLKAEAHQVKAKAPSTNPAPATAPLPPDPGRQGGWVQGESYAYLSKELLKQVDYRVLSRGQLTEEAAKLFGLSSSERDQVNRALIGFVSSFRSLERQHMEAVEPPQTWDGFEHDKAIAFKVPELTGELTGLREEFERDLHSAVGQKRANLLGENLNVTFDQQFESLGKEARTIGFVWQPKTDGTRSLWFARGEGNFSRVMPDLDPDSSIAYYASIMGVELPDLKGER